MSWWDEVRDRKSDRVSCVSPCQLAASAQRVIAHLSSTLSSSAPPSPASPASPGEAKRVRVMSLYFSNHQTLIKDCYPLKLLTLTPLADLRPDSNSLSKLTFYAAGRPKKLPKVASAILDRAERDSRTSGLRARADLAVTVDVMKALVEECTSELRCFVSQAMGVVKAALGRRLNGMYGSGDRDTEMEARAAGLVSSSSRAGHAPFRRGCRMGKLIMHGGIVVSCYCYLYDGSIRRVGRRTSSAISRLPGPHHSNGAVGLSASDVSYFISPDSIRRLRLDGANEMWGPRFADHAGSLSLLSKAPFTRRSFTLSLLISTTRSISSYRL